MSGDFKPTSEAWASIQACIFEIEWYATRKKILAEVVTPAGITWADYLMSDIKDLRKALAEIPGSPFVLANIRQEPWQKEHRPIANLEAAHLKILGRPATAGSKAIPKDIDDFPGPEDFGVPSSPASETLVDEPCCPKCDSEICICGLGSHTDGEGNAQ